MALWTEAALRVIVSNVPRRLSRQPDETSWHIRRAIDYMRDNLHLPLTMADVANAVGISDRSLQRGFRRFRHTTPAIYLRRLRLDAVHKELSLPENELPVNEVAQKWGVTHMGRFAAQYRAVFGLNPSDTAKKAVDKRYSGAPSFSDGASVPRVIVSNVPHRSVDRLNRQSDVTPWHIRRAIDYMRDNLHLPLTMADVANAVGISDRSLQHGFRRFRHTTPAIYLRCFRLDVVHRELSQPENELPVNEVAQKWGFTHMGRFAAQYRAVFGVNPSDTAKKAVDKRYSSAPSLSDGASVERELTSKEEHQSREA